MLVLPSRQDKKTFLAFDGGGYALRLLNMKIFMVVLAVLFCSLGLVKNLHELGWRP